MSIIINDQELPKAELIRLIKKSKMGAVRSIKKFTHIGLKDARAIVYNLNKNPNFYDGHVIKKSTTGFKDNENSDTDLENVPYTADSMQRKPILGSHFLKPNRSNKLLIFGLIGFALLLIYFFLNDKV